MKALLPLVYTYMHIIHTVLGWAEENVYVTENLSVEVFFGIVKGSLSRPLRFQLEVTTNTASQCVTCTCIHVYMLLCVHDMYMYCVNLANSAIWAGAVAEHLFRIQSVHTCRTSKFFRISKFCSNIIAGELNYCISIKAHAPVHMLQISVWCLMMISITSCWWCQLFD